MRLTRIEIDGFGFLRDFREDVTPGLHLFCGPNESGKSTLQRAILALLYGFYQGKIAKKSENEALERDRPWDGGPYGGRLEYELADGSRFRVEREFTTSDVPTSIRDLDTGRDVTDEFGRGPHGNVGFARKHIGMTKTVFEACAFVSQGELFAIADEEFVSPQEIGDTIVSLADSARRDISAQKAHDRLDDVLRESVGTARARVKPLPTARRQARQLEGELEKIDAVRDSLSSDASALEAADRRREELRERVARTSYLLLAAESADIEERIQQLDTLAAGDDRHRELLDDHTEFAAFPSEERDVVRRAWERISDLRDRLAKDRPEVDGKRGKLDDISRRKESLVHRQRELEHLRDYPVEHKDSLHELVIAWRNASAGAAEAAGHLGSSQQSQDQVHEYERLKSAVGGLRPEDVERLLQRLRTPSTAAPAGVIRSVVRAIGSALRWLWRQVVRMVRWLVSALGRRSTPSGTAEEPEAEKASVADSLSAEESSRLLGLYSRYQEIRPRVEKYLRDKEAAEDAASGETEAEQALQEALKGLVEDSSDLEAAYRQFEKRVEDHLELKSIDGKIESTGSEVSSLQQPIDRFEGDEASLSRQEMALTERLEKSAGASGDLPDLVEKFEEGCRRQQAYNAATLGLRENEEKRGFILGGKSRRELEKELSRAADETRRLLEKTPDLAGAQASANVDELEAELGEHRAELHECELGIAELRTTIEKGLDGLPPRAEVEEELERFRAEAVALERFGEELQVAMEVIEQAMIEAHRNFAPSVGRFLSDGMAKITGDRYKRVLLDPSTLRLTAEVPETRSFKDVEFLSRGTRAAAYLLLRAGLSQHMSSMGEPVPLVLDDPLVDLDDVRIENFLAFLLELSDQLQILLFTKDAATRAWLENAGGDGKSLAITPLSAPAS